MSARTLSTPRFVRRTSLGPGEYRKNFRQIDRDVIEAVTSPEADAVTPLMSKIYLKLVNAPDGCWERDGVLRFESEMRETGPVKAWSVLCGVLGVAGATANKALRWMHEQGIVGYFAGKNGVGIRIFLNRAASSVGKKILQFPPASPGARRASRDETAFKVSFADSEGLDSDLNSRAPKNGAEKNREDATHSDPALAQQHHPGPEAGGVRPARVADAFPVDEVVRRLREELEPCVRTAAAREHERTRQWLERSGIPKAARVAQHEAYDVLRNHGLINSSAGRGGPEVGRASETPAAAAKPLNPEEVAETAETCVALLEAQGKSVDATISEISAEVGGWLLPQDAPRVREAAQALLRRRAERG